MMQVELPLDQMTLAEKLETMEKLWEDLSRTPDRLPVPEWHHEVLQQRKRLVAEGKVKFRELDTVMAELRLRISEGKEG